MENPITVNTTHLVEYQYATQIKEHEHSEKKMKAPSEKSN